MSPTGYKAPAVEKAFRLLDYISGSQHEPGISEISQALGFGKSTTHGIVQALLKTGALGQNPSGKKLFLGPAVIELAFKSWNRLGIFRKSKPAIEKLRDQIGETIFLGVLSKSAGIIIATAEAAKPLKISSPPGTSIPPLAGAVGKIFLAHHDDIQALKIIRENGLPAFTEKSVTDEYNYLKELAKVRSNGYAIDDEEYMPGVRAVAAGLGNHRGLLPAIWVVGFASSMDDKSMPVIIEKTLSTAKELGLEFKNNR